MRSQLRLALSLAAIAALAGCQAANEDTGIHASGHIEATEVRLAAKVGGRLLEAPLEEGHKVKITLQFRGREMAHPELGSKILDDVLEAVGPAAKVDTQARLEGRSMSMTLPLPTR